MHSTKLRHRSFHFEIPSYDSDSEKFRKKSLGPLCLNKDNCPLLPRPHRRTQLAVTCIVDYFMCLEKRFKSEPSVQKLHRRKTSCTQTSFIYLFILFNVHVLHFLADDSWQATVVRYTSCQTHPHTIRCLHFMHDKCMLLDFRMKPECPEGNPCTFGLAFAISW